MIDLGDQVPISVTVRNSAGVLANPASATLTITKPDGTTVPGTIVTMPPADTGKPLYVYTTDTVGRHVWRMVTTTPAGAQTGVFTVRTGAPRWLISLDEARSQLNGVGTSAGDVELEEYLGVATDIVENIIGRVANEVVTEIVYPSGYALLLNRSPVVSVTSITSLDGVTAYAPADYYLSGDTGVIYSSGVQFIRMPVTVTYTVGRSNLPPDAAIGAAKIIIQHLWRTQQLRPTGPPSPLAPDNTQTVPLMGFAVPNAAVQMLTPHSRRRVWMAG